MFKAPSLAQFHELTAAGDGGWSRDRIFVQLNLSLLLGVLPTLAFLITVWLAARAGMKLIPMILTGYGVWALGAILLYLLPNTWGIQWASAI